MHYDGLDRVIETIDARGAGTRMEYDAVGNMLALTDARNNTTSFAYDGMNRIKSRTDSKGKIEQRTYDLNGNLLDFTDRRGQISRYTYDPMNRLVHEEYADGATVNRTYDARGLLLEADDSSGGLFMFEYDLAGRLVRSDSPFGTVLYTPDELGRVKQRQVAGQDPVDYAYDPVGNLLSAAMPPAALNYSYDDRNRIETLTRSNGVTTAYGYDPLGRIESITHANGGDTLAALHYTRNPLGNIIAKETQSAQPFVTQPAAFQIDAASNQLQQRGAVVYTNDANGNRLTETGPAGVTTYVWDGRNRLQSMTTPDGITKTFRYDFAGNLIEQTTSGAGVDRSVHYVLDDLTNVVHQVDSEGAQMSVLTGRAIDQHLAVAKNGGQFEFALSDSINSTVATTDDSGSLAGRFDYEPFGETVSAGSDFPFQFTGRVPVGGDLYSYRARYLDPLAGRFVSEDPIGFLGGINPYSYVNGSPINKNDPFGLRDDKLSCETEEECAENFRDFDRPRYCKPSCYNRFRDDWIACNFGDFKDPKKVCDILFDGAIPEPDVNCMLEALDTLWACIDDCNK